MPGAHDARLKGMLQAFFPDFVSAFLPDLRSLIDASAVEWLEQELRDDEPDGGRRIVDLVGRVPQRETNEPLTVLIHVEVESGDSAAGMGERMLRYWQGLSQKYDGEPVYPVVLFLRLQQEGLGWHEHAVNVLGEPVIHFRWRYIALGGLHAAEWVERPERIAQVLSALMKLPDRASRAEHLLRVLKGIAADTELTDQERWLLAEAANAYTPLTDAEKTEYDSIVQTASYREVVAMNKTYYERGLEAGQEQALRESLLLVGEKRFGAAPTTARDRIAAESDEQVLRTWLTGLLDAASWEAWLASL